MEKDLKEKVIELLSNNSQSIMIEIPKLKRKIQQSNHEILRLEKKIQQHHNAYEKLYKKYFSLETHYNHQFHQMSFWHMAYQDLVKANQKLAQTSWGLEQNNQHLQQMVFDLRGVNFTLHKAYLYAAKKHEQWNTNKTQNHTKQENSAATPALKSCFFTADKTYQPFMNGRVNKKSAA